MQISFIRKIQKNKRHGIILPFISVKMRILYAVIAGCTASACVVMHSEGQSVPPAGYAVAAIALLVACLTSYWELDCAAGVIRSVNGILGFTVRREYPSSVVEKIEREVFTKGFLKRSFVKYSFYTETGVRHVMGIVPQRTADAIDRQWEYITACLTAAEPAEPIEEC